MSSRKSNQELRLLIKNELQYLRFKNPKNSHHTKFIYKKYKDIIDNNTHFIKDKKFNQKVYSFINNIHEFPKCPYCNKTTKKFHGFSCGYRIFCSFSCGTKYNEKQRTFTTIKNINFKTSKDIKKDYYELINNYNDTQISKILYYLYEKDILKFKLKNKFNDMSLSQIVYRYIFKINDNPKCIECNKNNVAFNDLINGFNKYCGSRCVGKNKSKDRAIFVLNKHNFKFSGNIEKDFNTIKNMKSCLSIAKILYSYYKDDIDKVNFKDNMKINEKIYCLIHNITEPITCKFCNKLIKFKYYAEGYLECCSYSCSQKLFNRNKFNESVKYLKDIIEKDIEKDFKLIEKYYNKNILHTHYGITKLIYVLYKYDIDNKIKFTDDIEEKVYCYVHNLKEKQECKNENCNKKTNFISFKEGYRKYCSLKCSNNSISVKKLKEESLLYSYGVTNPSFSSVIQDRIVKNSYKRKEYILPSGNIVYVQGYEPQALDLLLKSYEETEIKIKSEDKPIIKYTYKNKEHRHFIDLYIPKENKIIEVKSDWTITLEPDRIYTKKQFAINDGYCYEIWIMTESGLLKEII